MAKKSRKGLLIGIVLFIVLIALASFNTFFAIPFDDFGIEDDFVVPRPDLWEFNIISTQCQAGGGRIVTYTPTIEFESGELVLTSRFTGSNPTATFLKDLKNNDIKTVMKFEYSHPGEANFGASGSASFQILLNEQVVFTETTQPTLGSISSNLLVELTKDFLDPEVVHVEVDGRFIRSVAVLDEEVRISYRINRVDGGCSVPGTATLEIDELKSKSYFNCKIENDEILIRDRFNEGSTYSVQDLTFKPIKFCIETYPSVKRSFTEEGAKADIQGQLVNKLARNEEITVGDNEAHEIFYIADFQEGMGERCSLDSAFDTTTNRCVKLIEEEFDVLEVINLRETIVVGSKDVVFDNSISFGNRQITSSKPIFRNDLNQCNSDKAISPLPANECWEVQVQYNNQEFKLIYGQDTPLDEFITLKALPIAEWDGSNVKNDFTNKFVLTASDDVFETNTVQEDISQFYVIFGSNRGIPFTIKNNLGTFLGGESGLQVKKTNKIVNQQTSQMFPLKISEGEFQYIFGIDSSILGEVEYELIPFYKIGDKIIFDNEKIIRNFEVVNQVPEDVKLIESDAGERSFFQKIIDFFRELLAKLTN